MTLETFSPGQKLRRETAKACRSFPEKDKGAPEDRQGGLIAPVDPRGTVEEGSKLPAVLREPSPRPRLFSPGSHRRIMPSFGEG